MYSINKDIYLIDIINRVQRNLILWTMQLNITTGMKIMREKNLN